jgi:hypothetical protein
MMHIEISDARNDACVPTGEKFAGSRDMVMAEFMRCRQYAVFGCGPFIVDLWDTENYSIEDTYSVDAHGFAMICEGAPELVETYEHQHFEATGFYR